MEFSRVVQQQTDEGGGEMSADAIWSAFQAEYLGTGGPLELNSVHTSSAAGEKDQLTVNVYVEDQLHELHGTGNGPIAAFVDAINGLQEINPAWDWDVRVLDYQEHALSSGGDAIAAAYVECVVRGDVLWGVGLDPNIVTASLRAVVSAVNRA
jgi:2-isopropylmalate synthase